MKRLVIIYSIFLICFIASCARAGHDPLNEPSEPQIIPQPVKITMSPGVFTVKKDTRIWCNNELLSAGRYMGSILGLQVMEGSGKGINLIIRDGDAVDEGYSLKIRKSNIEISAKSPAGIFYGIQTLLQFLPQTHIKLSSEDPEINIQCAEIEDFPRFKWRGLLLDVSRHFFTIGEVKRLIDEMAMYKFNILQLHLTDDQGWRIEIKSLPELTATGSMRVPRTGLWWDREGPQKGEKATYGGFYTQEQIKDLVKYAHDRNINILPEIEVPGHSLAAIASYPWLSSTGMKYDVNPGSRFYGIIDNSLCAGKESTYEYLDKVFTEVAGLFPFEYIHIGGDECYKGFWKKSPECRLVMKENGLKDENELQSYLVKRLEQILEAKGKKLIGWDEILEGGLAPNAAVMSWRGMEGGITAAKAKHQVVMSPVEYAYLDFYQGDPAIEPPTYSMLRLNKVYAFEPVPEGVDPMYILGGQGNLWTESVPVFRHTEYMLWPRSFALAEVLWSPRDTRDWKGFVRRTETHLKRLSEAGINYSVSFYDAIISPSFNDNHELVIELDTEIEGLDIFYTFDNTYPDLYGPVYKNGEKLKIPKDADTFRVTTYRDGKPAGRIISVSLAELAKRALK